MYVLQVGLCVLRAEGVEEWRSVPQQPVEARQLRSDSSAGRSACKPRVTQTLHRRGVRRGGGCGPIESFVHGCSCNAARTSILARGWLLIMAAPSVKRPFGEEALKAWPTSSLRWAAATRWHWWPSTIVLWRQGGKRVVSRVRSRFAHDEVCTPGKPVYTR